MFAELPFISVPEKLQRMADLTTTMVQQSLDAFIKVVGRPRR
jgi:phosphate uptake regulator